MFPGEYTLCPDEPIELFSDLTVEAAGAQFVWPLHWQGAVHRDMFKGVDICNFSWNGGCFKGYVFDVPPAVPTWAPECCARGIVIETSADGRTENLSFQNIEGENCSGSVVSVYGYLHLNCCSSNINSKAILRHIILPFHFLRYFQE